MSLDKKKKVYEWRQGDEFKLKVKVIHRVNVKCVHNLCISTWLDVTKMLIKK